MNFDDLRKASVRRCEESFFPVNDWTPTDWACAMAGEAGETCDAVKKLKRLETGGNTEKDPLTRDEAVSKIGGEIADTIVYLDLLAARLGIDLTLAVRTKFNIVSRRMNSNVYL